MGAVEAGGNDGGLLLEPLSSQLRIFGEILQSYLTVCDEIADVGDAGDV